MKLHIRLAMAAALLSSASAAMAGITYSGSVTPIAQFGAGNSLVADYTITTNGTIGNLTAADVTGWTVRFNYNGNIENLSGSAITIDYFYVGALVASATDLSFNFTRGPGFGAQFGIGSNVNMRQVFFTARGNEIIGPPNTAQITTFYINPSVSALYGGYNLPGSGLQVIASVAAVPEPASWAMLIAGFGLVGAAMRRGRRFAAA